MNLILHDFSLAKSVQLKWNFTPRVTQFCNFHKFPTPDVCSICYKNATNNFSSKRVVLRYLYAVYTGHKIL